MYPVSDVIPSSLSSLHSEIYGPIADSQDPSPAGQPSDIFFHLVPSVPIYVVPTPMATRLSFFSAEKYESMGGQGLSARKYLGS